MLPLIPVVIKLSTMTLSPILFLRADSPISCGLHSFFRVYLWTSTGHVKIQYVCLCKVYQVCCFCSFCSPLLTNSFFIIIISLSNLSISFPSWSIQRAIDDRVARTGSCGTLLKTLSPCPEKNSLLVICQLLSANVLDTGSSFWLHSEIAKNCMWNVRGDS